MIDNFVTVACIDIKFPLPFGKILPYDVRLHGRTARNCLQLFTLNEFVRIVVREHCCILQAQIWISLSQKIVEVFKFNFLLAYGDTWQRQCGGNKWQC